MHSSHTPHLELLPNRPSSSGRWSDGTAVNIYYVKPSDIPQMLSASKSLGKRIYAATYITNIGEDNLDPRGYRTYYELDYSVSFYLYQNLFKDYIYLSYDKLLISVLEKLLQDKGPDVCKALEKDPFYPLMLFNTFFSEHIENRDFSRFIPDLGLKIEGDIVKGRSIVALTSTSLRLLLNGITNNFDIMVNYHIDEAVNSYQALIYDLVGKECSKNMAKIRSEILRLGKTLGIEDLFRKIQYIAIFEAQAAKYYKHNMGIDWFDRYKIDDEEEMMEMQDYYYDIDDYAPYELGEPARVIPALVRPKSFAKKINVYVINELDSKKIASLTKGYDDEEDYEYYEDNEYEDNEYED